MAKPLPGLAHLLLGQPDISERLMRALALKGALPQFLGQEFDASVTVEDLTAPEFGYLRRFLPWQAGQAKGAVVGEFSMLTLGPRTNQLRNALAVCDYITISNQNAAAQSFRYGLVPESAIGSSAPVSNGEPMDDRVTANQPLNSVQPIYGVGVGSNAVDPLTQGPPNAGFVRLGVDQTVLIPGPWIITCAANSTAAARQVLAIWTQSVNLSVAGNFKWRERGLLATEF